jgi:hypothetical protein
MQIYVGIVSTNQSVSPLQMWILFTDTNFSYKWGTSLFLELLSELLFPKVILVPKKHWVGIFSSPTVKPELHHIEYQLCLLWNGELLYKSSSQSIVYRYHIFLTHSSAVGHLGCFHNKLLG